MTNTSATLPSPAAGRPLTTVNQIHYARKRGAVFCELDDGKIEQIYRARRQKGVFQVKLGNNRWTSSPRRVWAASAATEAAPDAQPAGKIHVTRTPVGDRSLDDLLTMAFQVPMWIEAPEGDLVVFPQFVGRRLSLKHWNHQDHPLFVAKTFAELAAFMRGQEGMGQLLDQDEQTPFRAWQLATPIVELDAVPSEGN
jgi:hypothetical protein